MLKQRMGLIVTIVAVALFGSAAVFAQMGGMMGRENTQTTPAKQEANTSIKQGRHMIEQGRKLMMQGMRQHFQAMQKMMKEQEKQLKEAVTTMKAAEGNARLDAVEKVVELLAKDHEQMLWHMQHMHKMMGEMKMHDGGMMMHGDMDHDMDK